MKNIFYSAIYFILIYSQIASQDIPRVIYSLLNFHSYEIITLGDLAIETREISSKFVYNDYYRKFISNQKTIGWDGNFWQISTCNSHIGEKLNYGLKANIQFSDYDYQNIKDEKAVRFQNHTDLNSVNFQIALGDGINLLGGGLIYRQTKNTMPLSITEFPSSDSPLINNIFLDYLEPTFGENLDINGNSTLINPLIFSSFPVYKQYDITILCSYLHQKHNIDIDYINSSNIDELTGNRSIEIPGELNNTFIQTILSKDSSSFQTSASYFNTDILLPFDNILPLNYTNPILQDLVKLGYIQGAHRGGSIEFKYSRNNYQLMLGIGMGRLSGSADLDTPVLGRNIVSFFIPISHGIVGNISGKNSSQKISINYNKLFKNTEFELFSSYTHGYFDLLIDGDAQPFYNIDILFSPENQSWSSIPVYHSLKYDVHIFDLRGKIKKNIGSINIIYAFSQIIPIIRRSDSSLIKFQQEIQTKYPTKYRGGTSYSISIQYKW